MPMEDPLVPKMKISQIIDKENLESQEEIEFLRAEIDQYLTTNMTNRAITISKQSQNQLSPVQVSVFFRKLEREENTKLILQYMLSFLTKIPAADKTSGELIDPIGQFKEFLQTEVALLNEEDVIEAILREHRKNELCESDNYWYYEARIMDMRLELEYMLAEIPDDQTEIYLHLFQVLKNLCLFWFDIGRENVRQARRSDIFMYKLACLLQNKLQKEEKPLAGSTKKTRGGTLSGKARDKGK
jgi:hypothetical protein